MKKKLRINFVDFWPSFHKKDNYFFHLLNQDYDVSIEENEPDLVIGSYGFQANKEILKYEKQSCLRIYYTGESDAPRSGYNLNITQRRGIQDKNHLRLPLWAFFCSWFGENPLVHQRDPSYLVPILSLDKAKSDLEAIRDSKQKFCNFLYADLTNERDKWFKTLSSLSHVESSGRAHNNTGGGLIGRGDQVFKIAYLSDFLFTLAIENCEVDGYLTEKMIHPMAANSIPIYWGDPNFHFDFNSESVIDARRLGVTETIEEIRYLCSSKNAWIDKMSKPWFKRHDFDFTPDKVLHFIQLGLQEKR